PPANDAFSAARTLTGTTGTTTGSSVGATLEPGEPQHNGDPNAGASIWFAWTAPSSGALRVDTIGSDFDTILAVYTGSSVSALTLVASNDNTGSYGDGQASKVRFSVTKNIT